MTVSSLCAYGFEFIYILCTGDGAFTHYRFFSISQRFSFHIVRVCTAIGKRKGFIVVRTAVASLNLTSTEDAAYQSYKLVRTHANIEFLRGIHRGCAAGRGCRLSVSLPQKSDKI